ncbi:zinc carboxypeptidase [Folsomia candida]|uniref:Zinc carboxypeptidase A 1 n=1 Tax=Folsomia candida TaxID=158441 RepID=A0A226EZ35_FOLCA|nr:zinc carboxypeptidase [Folsomia candida]OXA62384.1 Zinc carboxypeptidase A 1 [Folsomia candida]
MKLSLCLVFVGLIALALSKQVKYDNYKVFRITPQTEEERKVLLDLEENNPGVVFWKHVRQVGLPVDIMVPPHLLPMMEEGVKGRVLNMQEMVDDVQSLINAEAQSSLNAAPRLSWDAYYPVNEIYQFLDDTAAAHSAIATTGSFGNSFENRPLRFIRLNKGNTAKPIIFIDANIHAREWITNTIATWITKELLEGEAQGWLDTFNFVIVPVMNPDGYEYSRTTDRMWRKTRSNYGGGTCRGADPNRNFRFGWNTGGSSNQPCSDTYMGVSALSEPETAAAAAFLDTIASETIFYLSLHSYSQLILIPYGTDLGRVPDHAQHMDIGNAAATAIARRYGTRFTPGNIVELLYVASGASVDHMKGIYDTDLAYTFEMRDTGRYGFVLPADQITPSCLEFMDGLNVILERLATKYAK